MRFLKVLIVPLAVVSLVVGLLLGRSILFPPAFAPFDFPLQHIENPQPPGATPTIHFGEELKVLSVKCNTTNRPVMSVGARQWQSVDPPGTTIIDVVGGLHTYLPGCETRHFSNPVPTAVIDRTRVLLGQGHRQVLWRITGTAKPTNNRARVVIGVWTTDTFALVP